MATLTDDDIRALLASDPSRGWRAFVDRYTPVLLSLIERAGIRDYDEAMELYLNTCEHLSADNCARLRRHDPSKGPVAAWLGAVVRNVIVDWVRSRAGRRRLFQSIEALPPRAQAVFELFYWNDRSPSEICEILTMREGHSVGLADVFEEMDAIETALNDRHRRELLAMAVRSRAPVSLEAELEQGADIASSEHDPEAALQSGELGAMFERALASLPPEDAVIVRLKYVEGLGHRDIARALGIETLADARVKTIVARLRALLVARAEVRTS